MKKNYHLMLICLAISSVVTAQPTYNLSAIVYGAPVDANELDGTGYFIDGEVMEYSVCGSIPSIHIAIIDSTYCQPVNTCNNNFGQYNLFEDPDGDCSKDPNSTYTCRDRPENYFIFRSPDASSMQAMALFLNGIEDGHFILAYSIFPNSYSTIDPSFHSAFTQLGSTLIPALADNLPFIFFCKKGDSGSIVETAGAFYNSVISITVNYQCSPTGIDQLFNEGITIYPNPSSDELHIKLINNAGTTITVFDVIGNQIYGTFTQEKEVIINTSSLNSGMYFVRIEGARPGISTGRFIVE